MSTGPGDALPEGSELIIDRVQRQLQRIYEIETEHSVSEFLVTDAALVSQLEGGQPGTRDIQEKLLVRQDGEDIDVALYVERDVLTRLTQADPTRKLDRENLADYLVLLEGVSHFLYLDWNATTPPGWSVRAYVSMASRVRRCVGTASACVAIPDKRRTIYGRCLWG